MTVSVAAVLVYLIFLEMSGEVAYAQLAVTHTLVISGLVLAVLLRPPLRRPTLVGMGSDERGGDPRPAAMIMVLLILVFVAASVPLADDLFGLKPLQQPTDYVIVGLAVQAWVLLVNLFWWIASRWG